MWLNLYIPAPSSQQKLHSLQYGLVAKADYPHVDGSDSIPGAAMNNMIVAPTTRHDRHSNKLMFIVPLHSLGI